MVVVVVEVVVVAAAAAVVAVVVGVRGGGGHAVTLALVTCSHCLSSAVAAAVSTPHFSA